MERAKDKTCGANSAFSIPRTAGLTAGMRGNWNSILTDPTSLTWTVAENALLRSDARTGLTQKQKELAAPLFGLSVRRCIQARTRLAGGRRSSLGYGENGRHRRSASCGKASGICRACKCRRQPILKIPAGTISVLSGVTAGQEG